MNKETKNRTMCGHHPGDNQQTNGGYLMQNHYNRQNRKSKGQTVAMIISAAMLAAAIAVNVFVKVPTWEPDEEYPMANAKVSWEQTWFAGPWGEAE